MGLQLTWLVHLLRGLKRDPSRNREMGGAQALGGYQSFKKRNNQPKDSVGSGGGCLTKDANKGNGDEGGGQAMAMRVMAMAMATAMATAMTCVMVS